MPSDLKCNGFTENPSTGLERTAWEQELQQRFSALSSLLHEVGNKYSEPQGCPNPVSSNGGKGLFPDNFMFPGEPDNKCKNVHQSVICLSCPLGCQCCSCVSCYKLPQDTSNLLPPLMLLLFQSLNRCITYFPLPFRSFGQRATKLAVQFTSAIRLNISQDSSKQHILFVTMGQRKLIMALGYEVFKNIL